MKIKDLYSPILKYWWLILVSTILAGTTSYIVSRPLPPIYNTRATLLIGSAITQPNPSQSGLDLSSRLTDAYAAIAKRDIVANAVMKDLGLTKLPDYKANSVAGTPFLEIIVTDTNPQRAQLVANDIANQVVQVSPSGAVETDAGRLAFVNAQLDELQSNITQTQKDITDLQAQLNQQENAVKIADLKTQIDGLTQKLGLLQTNYATLLSNTKQGAVNTVSIIEPAALPRTPIGPNKLLLVAIGALAGFVLATGAAIGLEFLDDSVKNEEEILEILELPVIGYIPRMGQPEEEFVDNSPRSPIADSFRSLRTNLEFYNVEHPIKTLLVTSINPSEGKSTIAANLALITAQSGKKVILMEADLRKPSLTGVLGLEQSKGLSDVFIGRGSLQEVLIPWKKNDNRDIMVMLAGNPPPNPTELLDSSKMTQILDILQKSSALVVLDGPPLGVVDSYVIAKKVNGILLVVRHGSTRRKDLAALKLQLSRLGVPVLGVVVNGIPLKTDGYAGYYGHYGYTQYYGENHAGNNTKPKSKKKSREKKLELPQKEVPEDIPTGSTN